MNDRANPPVKLLEQASQGLLYMSESDYPYEVVRWDNPSNVLNEAFIRQQTGVSEDIPIETMDFADFYDPNAPNLDWYGEQEKADADKYRNCMKILSDHLTNLKVFRVGEVEVDIYILGQTEDGESVGLATKAIET